jgi:uncharacterized membrane protein
LKQLENNWATAVVATLIYMLLSAWLGIIPFWVGSIIGLLLSWSLIIVFLAFYRGKKDNLFEEAISPYKEDWARWVWTLLLMFLYLFFWYLLLVIPGVIKTYSYALVPFLLKDDKKLKYNKAIDKSRKLMDWHKLDLFVLDLTFIGWAILSILTLGIGFLWLMPYHQITRAAFYEDVIKNTK